MRRTDLRQLQKRLEQLEAKVAPADALEGLPYEPPEPTAEQLIDWIDSERIPEYLEAANGGWAHNERGWYPSKEAVEAKLAWCHETLAWLQLAYEQGAIDADTYSRLITKQPYGDEFSDANRDQLKRLKLSASYFRPAFMMTLPSRSDGRKVGLWYIRTGPERDDRIEVYRVGDEWRQYPSDFKPYQQPGW